MKYSLQVFAIISGVAGATPVHTSEREAENDHAAVDLARSAHDAPEDGGDYEMVVSCLDTMPGVKQWVAVPGDPAGKFVDSNRSPGEICRFRVTHEPAAHRRAEFDKAAAERELEQKRAAFKEQVRAELIAELGLTAEQVGKMSKGVTK